MADEPSQFVALPIRHGSCLRLFGPDPREAAVAVDILSDIDAPMTALRFCLGAACAADGSVVQPLEVVLVADATATVPHKQVPAAAVIRALRGLPAAGRALWAGSGFELLEALLGEARPTGPILYCRKRHRLFVARSPRTGAELRRVSAVVAEQIQEALGERLPPELVCWDASADEDAEARLYGGVGGRAGQCEIAPLDELILGQGQVAARAATLRESDPAAAAALDREHACVPCAERARCYPEGGGYAYAADRLTFIGVTEAPLVVLPLGEWRLSEAARIIGGVPPAELAEGERLPGPLRDYRRRQAERIEAFGPVRLLAGETDGRELLELARLKLGLVEQVLGQLDAAWRAVGRPHLCWNADTVRVTWRAPAATPAAGWGLQPLLRKIGLHPASDAQTLDGRPLCYPPGHSEPWLLPPEVVEAARYFGVPRPGTLFVQNVRGEGDELKVEVLLEDFGVPWRLFTTRDALHVTGEGWRAVLGPRAERNPDDGEGLPLSGRVSGAKEAFRAGAQLDGCACTWYPRFGEAVDLHALGVLALECLLSHDERNGAAWHQALAAEREELTRTCAALPPEQREELARRWIEQRCEEDTPTAMWSRRNLLYSRPDRNAARLDAFPPALWSAILSWGLRLVTAIAGFSFCPEPSAAAPRIHDGALLPLLELRGLLAMLDDHLFGRTAPAAAVREALK